MKRQLYLFITILVSVLSLSAETRVVAHRGYWTTPGSAQNSLASFAKADSIAIYGSEMDVWMTIDGKFIVNHDLWVDGINVAASTFDEVRKIRLSNGEQLPSLDEYLENALKHPDVHLVLEIKPLNTLQREDESARGVVEALQRYGLVDRTDIISFSVNTLIAVRKLLPNIPIYYLTGDLSANSIKNLGFTGMDYYKDIVFNNPNIINEAHAQGLKVNVWTLDDPVDMQHAIDLGADFITTDEPVKLQRLLDKKRAQRIADRIADPSNKDVTVVLHRGDWRHYPENSVEGILGAIAMGGDMVEIDLAMTADSVLVLCHDRTLDRTTTGKGLISDLPYDSIRTVRLRGDDGNPTDVRMPTARKAFRAAKGRIMMNIDKGGLEYFDQLQALADEMGVTYQIVNKGKWDADKVQSMLDATPDNKMMYMPIIDILKPQGQKLWAQYAPAGRYPLAYEVCWNTMTPAVKKCFKKILKTGSRLWVNTLWDSLNGGLTDDAAFNGNPDEVYGSLVKMGATMIQTDRPELLLDWLRANNLHDWK